MGRIGRIESVDFFRFLAITAVVSIHTGPVYNGANMDAQSWHWLAAQINQLVRFAVPFFFVISGYFWGVKVRNSSVVAAATLASAKRLALLFVVWSVLYDLPDWYKEVLRGIADYGWLGVVKVTYWRLLSIIKDPLPFLTVGTMFHLWFFSALLCSLAITSLCVWKKYHGFLIAVSISLFIVGLLAKSYVETPFGIRMDFDTRNGPFFGTIFFVAGYYLASFTPNSSWLSKGLAVFLFGLILQSVEVYLLWTVYGTGSYDDFAMNQEYVIGTFFVGLGVSMAALSNHSFFRSKHLSNLGKFTLGIYVIHIFFVNLFQPVDEVYNSLSWEIGYVLLILFLSVTSVLLLSANKFTRWLVV